MKLDTYSRSRRSMLALAVMGACALLVVWLAQVVSAAAHSSPANSLAGSPNNVASGPSACGPGFGNVTSQNQGSHANNLSSVSAVSSSNIWAVGSYLNASNNEKTLIEHWDGSSWTIVSSPNVANSSQNELLSVAGTASNMWAVGNYIDSNGHYATLIEHWDGSSWAIVSSPNPGTTLSLLNSVAVGSATDAWAVGGYVEAGLSNVLIEHWDGSTWSVMPGISPTASGDTLFSVDIVSASDVWAVGHYYSNPVFHALAEHWNGSAWTQSTALGHGADGGTLNAVTAISASDIWAAGSYYDNTLLRLQTLFEHWDGASWTIHTSFNRASVFNEIKSISANATNDIWAVGYTTPTGSSSATLIEHWDGASWTEIPSTNPTSRSDLSGVDALTSSNVVTVGYYENGDISRTLIETLDTCFVTPTPTACPIQFSDVPAGSTYYSYVHCLACSGIISGYADGTFRPNNNVSRGQLSKIVSNAAALSEDQTVQQFQDVPVGSTYFQFVGRLASSNLINGYDCGGAGEPCVAPGNLPYFRPNNSATRGQITKIVANAAYFTDPPSGQQFQDVPVGSTFYSFAYELATRSIMGGYPCGRPSEPCVAPGNLPYFRPNANATRGQTSKIVGNTFFPNCQITARAKK